VRRKVAAKIMAESQIGSPMLKLRVPLILDPPDEAWFDIGLMPLPSRADCGAGPTSAGAWDGGCAWAW
jgi:hypothetical protein